MTGSIRIFEISSSPQNYVVCTAQGQTSKYDRLAQKIGPINIGSRVKDTISSVFIPQTVGANSVHLRHETTNRVTA